MCEFKYCKGTGSCFLSKTSPCAGKTVSKAPAEPVRGRSVRTSYAGFLDHNELTDILEMAEPVEHPSTKRLSDLVGSAPAFLRRALAS